MEANDESRKILEKMELQKLQEEYEAEMRKFHIQKHLIDALKRIKVDQLKDIGTENKENIAKAMRSLHLIDYTKMGNSGVTVLGVQTKPVELLYTEKKAIRVQLAEDLPKIVTPMLNFARTIDENLFHPEKLQNKLIELETRRRQLTMDVAAAKIKENQVLQQCADLKFGPHQKNVAELLRLNVAIDQIKGEILKDLVCSNMLGRTTHTVKALQEMEHVLAEDVAKIKTAN